MIIHKCHRRERGESEFDERKRETLEHRNEASSKSEKRPHLGYMLIVLRKWVSGKDPLFNGLALNDLPVNKFGNAIGRHIRVPITLWIDNKNGALHTDSQTASLGPVTGGWAIRKGQVLLLQIAFERRPSRFALLCRTAAFANAQKNVPRVGAYFDLKRCFGKFARWGAHDFSAGSHLGGRLCYHNPTRQRGAIPQVPHSRFGLGLIVFIQPLLSRSNSTLNRTSVCIPVFYPLSRFLGSLGKWIRQPASAVLELLGLQHRRRRTRLFAFESSLATH